MAFAHLLILTSICQRRNIIKWRISQPTHRPTIFISLEATSCGVRVIVMATQLSCFILRQTNALKISYAASIGSNVIPEELKRSYTELLGRYKHISVRENSGAEVIRNLLGKEAKVVLDPTLLLNKDEWNNIATSKRVVKKKYILCYFLNYTFNSFPYVDDLAVEIQRQTGYEIVRVARPPHKLAFGHTTYKIGASPEEFLALVRDSEIVLTTSFHGTAFAVNYGKPVFSIVQDRMASDSRQVSLMHNLGLDKQVLSIKDKFPMASCAKYDVAEEQTNLANLRKDSKQYLEKALRDE